MLQKIAIIVTVLVLIVVGFFAVILEKRIESTKIETHNQYTEAESYCIWKGGEILIIDGVSYCSINGDREITQSFFDRLGE